MLVYFSVPVSPAQDTSFKAQWSAIDPFNPLAHTVPVLDFSEHPTVVWGNVAVHIWLD